MRNLLVSGPDYVYSMAHRAIVKLVKNELVPYVVDCANTLDVYFLIREAEQNGLPSDYFLKSVRIARAFNPYQIVSIIKKIPRGVPGIILAPVSQLTDKNEGISYRESLKVLGLMKKVLKSRSRLLFVQHIPSKDGRLLDTLAGFIDFKVLLKGGVIMGRTIMPYSMSIELQRERLKKFRRSLRKEDREYLDEIFKYAKKHVQAGSYSAFPDPLIPIFLSAFIEQEKKIKELEEKVRKLENGLLI